MPRLILSLWLLLGACSPPEQPGPQAALSFSGEGGTYAWRAANGAKGGLLLVPGNPGAGGRPVLVITCDNLRTGALQARVFRAEPAPTALTLSAGDAILTVPGRRGWVGDQAVLEGEGALPGGWAEALGTAPTLKLRYGDQGVEVQGPGPVQAERFGRHCRRLETGAR